MKIVRYNDKHRKPATNRKCTRIVIQRNDALYHIIDTADGIHIKKYNTQSTNDAIEVTKLNISQILMK